MVSNTIFAGTTQGFLKGHVINTNDETVLNNGTNLGDATFIGQDVSTTRLRVQDISATGDISGINISATQFNGTLTGNVTGNLNGNIEKTSGILDISAADISLNATNDIRLYADDIIFSTTTDIRLNSGDDIIMNASGNINMDNGRSKIKFNYDTSNIEIDVSDNIIIAPQNGIIDLNGNTCARNGIIRQGLEISSNSNDFDVSASNIVNGFMYTVNTNNGNIVINLPDYSDVEIASPVPLTVGTVFPTSYIVNTDTNDVSFNNLSNYTMAGGVVGGNKERVVTFIVTNVTSGDEDIRLIIT